MSAFRRTVNSLHPPDGFVYRPDLIDAEEESQLVGEIETLPFQEFEFYGYRGKRRVVSFGERYDFSEGRLEKAAPFPAFLRPVTEKAAGLVGVPPEHFVHILVTEYTPGSPIGWHRDRPVFDEICGISLLSPCLLRFRRRFNEGFERYEMELAPRSAYVLSGEVRRQWDHSIPPVDALRYSITFRTLRTGPPAVTSDDPPQGTLF